MKLRILAALLAAPILALAQGAAKDAPKASAKDAVATVNGVAVPRSRLDLSMRQQMARGAPDTEQTRAAVRDELVNRELVAQEAVKSGIAKTPEVRAQMDLARQEIIIDAYIRDYVTKHPISDAEIQKEYDRIRAQDGEKEYKVRHIQVETEDQAKSLVEELKKGGKFDALASKNSRDAGTKDRGGDLDWVVPRLFDKPFADALIKLEKGKYTEAPVHTRGGFHIIQLDDVRPIKFPPLAEVKPRVQQQVVNERIGELIRTLRAKAKIE